MHGRAMEQQAACICLYSHGYFAPAEALCRTVVEAAVNLFYSSLGDSCARILTYFKSHIETERKQNKAWLASLKMRDYSNDDIAEHLRRIEDKDVVLATYEQILTEAFSQIGVHYNAVDKDWPSIFDRFKAIGKEVSYRTVYAALCSQAHNDAEDLLNDFVHGVRQVDGMHEKQVEENKNFSLYTVLIALTFLVEATAIYLAKYDLVLNNNFFKLHTEILEITEEIIHR